MCQDYYKSNMQCNQLQKSNRKPKVPISTAIPLLAICRVVVNSTARVSADVLSP